MFHFLIKLKLTATKTKIKRRAFHLKEENDSNKKIAQIKHDKINSEEPTVVAPTLKMIKKTKTREVTATAPNNALVMLNESKQ